MRDSCTVLLNNIFKPIFGRLELQYVQRELPNATRIGYDT